MSAAAVTPTESRQQLRIAAIDLGSNSFHLVVVEAHADGSFDVLAREKEVLRLGDAVARTQQIGDERAERAVDTMRRFVAIARNLDAVEIVACATAAFREAEDSSSVCDAIADETGVRVEVISGTREARLVFNAVRRSVTISKPPAVCLDLGGGSLEVGVGDASGLLWSTSVHLGVARLATGFLTADPPPDRDLRRLRDHVIEVLEPVAHEVARYGPRTLIVTSGTFCDLGRMAAATTGSVPMSVNQLTVRKRDLNEVHRALIAVPAEERARMPGLDARRADQIPAGSVVLLAAMKLFDISEMTCGDWALREGVLLETIERHDPVDWSGDADAVRRASVLALARRCNWDEPHATAVSRIATDLFDQLEPVHGLGSPSRQLLEYAALLHDIGEHVSVDGHHKHTAYLIENGRLRGFEPEDIDALSTLGRYHRRGRPGSSFEPWRRVPSARRPEVLALLALLQVADGLDRGHAGVVRTFKLAVGDRAVRISVDAVGDADLEVWGVRRKRELFEEVFDRRLELVASDHPTVAGVRNV